MICFVCNKYPNPVEVAAMVFVQQLVWTIADCGKDCIVISPLPININSEYKTVPYKVEEVTEAGNKISVYFPKYISAGQHLKIGPIRASHYTVFAFRRAVEGVLKRENIVPDLLYGHFVTPAGIAVADIGKKQGIASYLGFGESSNWSLITYGLDDVKRRLSSLTGIVSVSSKNTELYEKEVGVTAHQRIGTFPNGYRPERFFPIAKAEARQKLGLPADEFIVGFVGTYNESKGIMRLQSAVDRLEEVQFIAAGKGSLKPTSKKCLLQRVFSNDELLYFYNSIDAFVLPTLNEGCCNAIIEAIACGCPIISSDLHFNDDTLDETNSIRIDSTNIDAISEAIKLLKDDVNLRNTLKKGSIEKAKDLTLEKRARSILRFWNF